MNFMYKFHMSALVLRRDALSLFPPTSSPSFLQESLTTDKWGCKAMRRDAFRCMYADISGLPSESPCTDGSSMENGVCGGPGHFCEVVLMCFATCLIQSASCVEDYLSEIWLSTHGKLYANFRLLAAGAPAVRALDGLERHLEGPAEGRLGEDLLPVPVHVVVPRHLHGAT